MPRAMLSLGLGVDVIADLAIEIVEVGSAADHDAPPCVECRMRAIAPASLSHLPVSTVSCLRPFGVSR